MTRTTGFDPEAGRLQGVSSVVDAQTAASAIDPDDVVLVSGFGGVGYPKRVPEALASGYSGLGLTVVSGGGVGAEIDDRLVESGNIARRYPFQTRRTSRNAINDGRVGFHDRHISRFGDEVRFGEYGTPDLAIVEAVAVGDGWLVPSTSIGHTPSFVAAADRLIVEVNRTQPLELARVHDVYLRELPPNREAIPLEGPTDRIGGPAISFDPATLVAVVETDRADDPYEFRDPDDTDRQIAEGLGTFLEAELDGNPMLAETVHLQFGVGSMGNALMGTLGAVDFGDRDVVYFGEVFQDGLLDSIDSGLLSGASATSLALSETGQRRLFADIDRYAADVTLRPASVSNNPALVERFGVVGVNSAIEVDLYGNANATHIGGTHLVNGIGGGGDFNRNCRLSVLALPSTAGDGDISRIVPMCPHVDHTEHDFSVVVTEHGIADLRGATPRERARALVDIADPSFRRDLRAYLRRAKEGGGNTPHDLETVFEWQNSRD
ncbi:Acetyl-CoA hydrolase [Halalkaliarchaeum sp. AArc-CO]|uniref:acetyl-CoA hydrolase/transferase C-terminal domain-containing protein n=1 Tax=unclassified Halalkaliarchaeum TaxID=2678344 RepID=UPI00217EEB9F|nr:MULTISPECIES: acetyl-CoA hydrolase/transferase C-terminal domain-containing protein [unclassified Halalkaliarchaeum]MDR5671843.1 acetyl-CoA hydrolase/transferase C-terminal domain-containing protein [Halalkaliarchaeum sp. AArc-GB]UWG51346.1 Acetyl-CoA hydrolase [Halalkaliarchaeum sp. AArc-CO]